MGRVALQIRRRRLGAELLGGRGAGRLERVSRGDHLDVSSAQYFVNSSLPRALLLRRRSGMLSVSTELAGLALPGALGTLDPPDLHGFCKFVFDAPGLLHEFVRQVRILVIDHITRFELIFVPPSPFLGVEDKEAQTSRILVDPPYRCWVL